MVQYMKSINVTYYIRRLQDNMVASINTEKAPGKIQHSFILKILKKLRIGKTDLQPTLCEIRETPKQLHYCPFSLSV